MWEKVRLGDYIQLLGGGTPSKDVEAYWNGDIPWVSVKDFKEDHITSTQDLITIEGVKNSATRIIPADTLLIATRMAVGKVAINTVDVAINQDIKAITCNKELFPKFLFYFFKANEQHLQSLASGATVKGIKINHITDLAIPLPPIPVQQRIADILDKADALRRKDQELLKKYDQLAQAIFIDMFGDPVKNEKGWEVKKLEDLGELSSGSTPSRSNPSYFKGSIPWVKTTEVKDDFIFGTSEKISEEALAKSSCKLYPPNSLVIAMYGQGKTRGQSSLLKIEATTNQACCVVSNMTDQVSEIYLLKLFKLLYNDLRDLGRGGNQPNLNIGILKGYKIILPPIHLQQTFSERIELINSLKAKTNAEKSGELFQALLQRAFKGGG